MASVAIGSSPGAPGTTPQARKLRVGVFADSPLQPRWAVEALARLAASDFAEVVLVQALGAGPSASAPLAWQLYEALDRRFFGAAPTDPVPLSEYLNPPSSGSVPELGLSSGTDPELADLDVAFVLGDIDDEALAGRARHGVWRFCFGADGSEPLSLAGLAEVAAGQPLCASGLKVRTANDRPARLAYQSWSRTYPFSVARNRDQVLRKTGEFALRALRELHRSGERWLGSCREVPPHRPSPTHAGLPELGAVVRRVARRAFDRALHLEQWMLAFAFDQEAGADLAGFTRLVPPPDRDWADPFVLEKGGRHFVFFEELPYAERKAHISMVEIQRDGAVSAPQRVLECDWHLSYPFLFEHDGELYMVPESARNRSVDLYRCIDFPLVWRREATLIEGLRLVDATLHHDGRRWWMFANSAPEGSRMFDDELHLFSAETLTGEWKPHPKNPVKSDARSARPAGGLFRRGNALYRPAQICVPRYGAGLALHRVTRLTHEDYAELPVARLVPPPASGLFGLHTMNRAGDLTVVDAFIRRRRI